MCLNGKGFHSHKKAGNYSGFGDYLLLLKGEKHLN